MKFSEDYAIGTNVIRSFSDATIDINSTTYSNSLVVGNQLLLDNWGISQIEEMTPSHWQALLDYKPEVIIIGTGKSLVFPHPSSYALLVESGIGVEFMDSAAACRTYNVLVSEDRSVIAGIIIA